MAIDRGALALLSLIAGLHSFLAAATTERIEGTATASSVVLPAVAFGSQDPCALAEVIASPTRPNWDTSAATTQCGVLESDYGWMSQPLGGGVHQWMLVSSIRYGLTPAIDLRWGLTNRIGQSGGGAASVAGSGDQWVNVRYRFVEQSRWMPALAFSYGVKIPTANPAKSFGPGYSDNQFTLIASRDVGKNHFDFNVVGTEVGEAAGKDGSAQFGLALTRPMTTKLSLILESYGGPQPGTSNRLGAGFTGMSYVLRPTLVVDAAYVRTYTAGSPRQQILVGMTYAMRPGLLPLAKRSSLVQFLERKGNP